MQTTASEMTTVTARQLLQAMAGMSHVYMHGDPVYNRPAWSDDWTFRLTAAPYDDKGTKRQVESIPARVSNGNTSEIETYVYEGRTCERYSTAFRPARGFWSLLGAAERLHDALAELPAEAAISFYVGLDHGTNQNLVSARMHCDALFVEARFTRRGKEVKRRYLLDYSTGPHNTARFGASRDY